MGTSTSPQTSAAAAQTAAKPDRNTLDQAIEQTMKRESLTWKVADTGEELVLSISHVRKLFANPTASGQMPTDKECWLFLQLCKARGLNPYLGDAFLVGFDGRDGAKFSLITSHQALLKRAEASGKKKGMESGVIVMDKKTGEVRELPGDFFMDDREQLVGGWCKVYRTDYEKPIYDRLKLSTYDKNRSRWSDDKAGMIVKCTEMSAHRLAFPAETGGMYVREEMDGMHHESSPDKTEPAATKSRSSQIADDLASRMEQSLTKTVVEAPEKTAQPQKTETMAPVAQETQPDLESDGRDEYAEFLARSKQDDEPKKTDQPTAPATKQNTLIPEPKATSAVSDKRGSNCPEWKSAGIAKYYLDCGKPELVRQSAAVGFPDLDNMTGAELVELASRLAEIDAAGELKRKVPVVRGS